MTTPFKYILSIAALTAALTLSAKANFIVDDNPSRVESKIFLMTWRTLMLPTSRDSLREQPPVTHHGAYPRRGERKFGQRIRKHQTGTRRELTQLIFTPDGHHRICDFSFRGQLKGDANGMVSATVMDNLGNSQTFNFLAWWRGFLPAEALSRLMGRRSNRSESTVTSKSLSRLKFPLLRGGRSGRRHNGNVTRSRSERPWAGTPLLEELSPQVSRHKSGRSVWGGHFFCTLDEKSKPLPTASPSAVKSLRFRPCSSVVLCASRIHFGDAMGLTKLRDLNRLGPGALCIFVRRRQQILLSQSFELAWFLAPQMRH